MILEAADCSALNSTYSQFCLFLSLPKNRKCSSLGLSPAVLKIMHTFNRGLTAWNLVRKVAEVAPATSVSVRNSSVQGRVPIANDVSKLEFRAPTALARIWGSRKGRGRRDNTLAARRRRIEVTFGRREAVSLLTGQSRIPKAVLFNLDS